jgi:hypothetical protein
LLGTVLKPIQITPAVADDIATALRASDTDGEQHRLETLRRLEQRHHGVTAKLDRGYDDYVSGRISEEFWTRRSQEWETELQGVDGERARCAQPRRCLTATGLQILELAKQAEFLYKTQPPPEQRRLLKRIRFTSIPISVSTRRPAALALAAAVVGC